MNIMTSKYGGYLSLLFFCLIFFATFFIYPQITEAVVRTWDGGGTDGAWGGAGTGDDWTCDANWSDDTEPGTADVATFDGTCVSNCSADVNSSVSVLGIDINAGYASTITQTNVTTVTIGSTGYDQSAGTFTGGDSTSHMDINDAGFTLSAGAFTEPGGNMNIERSFTITGSPTFTHNSGTIEFDDSNSADDTTIDCGTITLNKVTITKNSDADMIISSGCTVPLGASPTSALSDGSTFTNNGTITVASGTWTITKAGAAAGTFTNNGTITHSGTGWVSSFGFINGVSATVTYSGSAISVGGNFDVSSGTFPSGLTVTFTDASGNDDTTMTCGSVTFTQVIITKDSEGDMIISSGCTVPLGACPTSVFGRATFTNNGTITVDSGTWTITDTSNTLVHLVLTNNGTITHNGTGWINGRGFANGSSGIVTYAGTTMSVADNLDVSLGTFPSGLTVTFTDDNGNDNSILTCGSVTFTQVIINKDSVGSMEISSGCTVPLGANPTTNITADINGAAIFTNNCTISVSSGTWTIVDASTAGNWRYHTLTNNGTITHSGTGWVTGGSFVNGSSGVVTYAGSTISVAGNLDVSTGTFPRGLTLTFVDDTNIDNSTLTCGSVTFGDLTINKNNSPTTMDLGGNCTVTGSLTFTAGTLSNPASAMTLTVQGDSAFNSSGTFGGANLTLSLEGSSNNTISKTAGTFASKLKVNKTVGNSATLTTALAITNTFEVNSGTFSQGATFDLPTGGATTVGASGTWTNTGTGDVTLGCDLSNAGVVTLNSNGTTCGDATSIVLSDAGSTQRTWSGAGTFTLQDLNVSDMA